MLNQIDKTSNHPPTSRAWKALFTALTYLPWVWLLLLGLLTLAVTLQVGHFPSYGRPDPKDTGYLVPLYMLSLLLIAPTLFSPIFWALLGLGKHFFDLPFRLRRQGAVAFILGWAAAAFVALSDLAGLITWLVD